MSRTDSKGFFGSFVGNQRGDIPFRLMGRPVQAGSSFCSPLNHWLEGGKEAATSSRGGKKGTIYPPTPKETVST